MYFGECAHGLHELIPPSPFHYWSTRCTAGYHSHLVTYRFVVPTKRFSSTFIVRRAKLLYSLPASVFPTTYDPTTFKARVNRHLLGSLVPSKDRSRERVHLKKKVSAKFLFPLYPKFSVYSRQLTCSIPSPL